MTIEATWEDIDATKIEGTSAQGRLVLDDGQAIYWDTDDGGQRFYFVPEEVPDGPLTDGDELEGLVVYCPMQVPQILLIAAISVENVISNLEKGKYGPN